MATIDVQNYYSNLLILQYLQKPKAYDTIGTSVNPILMPDSNIQHLDFSTAPTAGSYKLVYGGVPTTTINWNDSESTIEAAINAVLPGGTHCVVVPLIDTPGYEIRFSLYTAAFQILQISNNTLTDALSNAVRASIKPLGDQLPLEIQNAFNLIGSDTAVGVQLDILAKYVGVKRSGFGFSGPITLDDADFLILIQMGIVRNNSGSSLAQIQLFLAQFFAGEIYLTDFADMHMSYLINTSIGSQNLIELFVTEGLLPKPMGVGISVIANSVINKFFGFRTYTADIGPLLNIWNNYTSYDTTDLFLSYSYAVIA